MRFLAIFLSLFLVVTSARAESFTMSFEWGDIPLCTSGQPNTVTNPFFKIDYVPKNTVKIYFKLIDEDVPTYKHGGGMVKYYQGARLIKPGKFEYKSPCPPNGSHKYTWTAYALDKNNRILSHATSSVRYPK